MIILMNKGAKKEQISLVLNTLESQDILPIYIKAENAISALPMKQSVDISAHLLKNLPGIEKIIIPSEGKIVN
jgi:hypothetical protein